MEGGASKTSWKAKLSPQQQQQQQQQQQRGERRPAAKETVAKDKDGGKLESLFTDAAGVCVC